MKEKPQLLDLVQTSMPSEQVRGVVDEYHAFYAGTAESRKANYARLVNAHYDLVTDFYEYGWGQSFHFAPRHAGESLETAMLRYELYLAHVLGLRPGMTVLDVGCGVGGPMRSIARFSGASVVGVNNNEYQIQRGTRHNEAAQLSALCSFLKADFMDLPVPDQTYDAAYAIEATCHAPDKVALFREMYRVLKPGAGFAGYEWCLTDRYDRDDPGHRALKEGIEVGNGLPDLWYTTDVVDALEAAGFEVLGACDRAATADPKTPWHRELSMTLSLSPKAFKRTKVGRTVSHALLHVLEALRVAPRGATAVSDFLVAGGQALVKAGQAGVFTPMYFFHARKPASPRA
jgi:sterol 24-C-methyltransferase